jgi:hypothetical protein
MAKKYYLFIALLLTAIVAQAQNDSLPTKQAAVIENTKSFRFNNNIRLNFFLPNGIGDNYISRASKGIFGVGLKINFLEFHNVNVGPGFDFLVYDITDSSKAGRMDNAIINNVYLEFMYRIPVSETITLFPKVSGGATMLHYTGESEYGEQTGPRYSAGFYADYKVLPWLEAFAGLDYSRTFFSVNTVPEYKDYFEKVQQLNVSVGLKFNLKR